MKTLNILAAFGLALGATLGMAGTFVSQPHVQAFFWTVDGVGLVISRSFELQSA